MKCDVCGEGASRGYYITMRSWDDESCEKHFCSKGCMGDFGKCRYCSSDYELVEMNGYVFCNDFIDDSTMTCLRKYELKKKYNYGVDMNLSDEEYKKLDKMDRNLLIDLDEIKRCRDSDHTKGLVSSLVSLIRVLSKDHEHHDRIIDVMNSLT